MKSPEPMPLQEVPAAIIEQLARLGAPPDAASNKLYRVLANNPTQLTGWIEMAWRLRQLSDTSARLREVMILRGAQVADCEFERIGHTLRARAAGVPDEVIDQVAAWQESSTFTPDERIALRLMEDMVAGSVSDETLAELADHFSLSEQIELILTAGFYVMVPRVIDALRLVRDPD